MLYTLILPLANLKCHAVINATRGRGEKYVISITSLYVYSRVNIGKFTGVQFFINVD